jgi:hypothetical protein
LAHEADIPHDAHDDGVTTEQLMARYAGTMLVDLGSDHTLFRNPYWFVGMTLKTLGAAIRDARSPGNAVRLVALTFPLNGLIHLPYRSAALMAAEALARTKHLASLERVIQAIATNENSSDYPDSTDTNATLQFEQRLAEKVSRWLQETLVDAIRTT